MSRRVTVLAALGWLVVAGCLAVLAVKDAVLP